MAKRAAAQHLRFIETATAARHQCDLRVLPVEMCAFNRMLRANSLLLLVLFAACLAVGEDVKAVENYERYINENRRMYRECVTYFEENIAQVKVMYQQQLDVLDQVCSQIGQRLENTINQLQAAESISPTARDCVGPNRKQLPDMDDIARLKSCVNAGRSLQYKYVEPLNKKVRTLNSFYKNTFNESLTKCRLNKIGRDNANCVTTAIENATATTFKARQDFDIGLKQEKLASEIRISDVVAQTLKVTYDIVTRMNTTMEIVKSCFTKENIPVVLLVTGD